MTPRSSPVTHGIRARASDWRAGTREGPMEGSWFISLPAVNVPSWLDQAAVTQTVRELGRSAAEHGYACEVSASWEGHIEWKARSPEILRQVIDGLERMRDEEPYE